MNPNDPMVQFLLSGDAHAYYAVGGIMILALLIVFGGDPRLAALIGILAAGIFVDLWTHQYLH